MNLWRLTTRFRKGERGSSTVEFVILFPLYMMIFLMTVEAGIFMFRHVMLDRSVDMAVRDIRLSTGNPPTFEQFKTRICGRMMIDASCERTIQVELRPVDTTTWQGVDDEATCRDITQNINPRDETTFTVGGSNELMMVQVCGVFQPIIPLSVMGMRLQSGPGGTYAVVIKSGFVNEPSS